LTKYLLLGYLTIVALPNPESKKEKISGENAIKLFLLFIEKGGKYIRVLVLGTSFQPGLILLVRPWVFLEKCSTLVVSDHTHKY
jgi:hypothetical protein